MTKKKKNLKIIMKSLFDTLYIVVEGNRRLQEVQVKRYSKQQKEETWKEGKKRLTNLSGHLNKKKVKQIVYNLKDD